MFSTLQPQQERVLSEHSAAPVVAKHKGPGPPAKADASASTKTTLESTQDFFQSVNQPKSSDTIQHPQSKLKDEEKLIKLLSIGLLDAQQRVQALEAISLDVLICPRQLPLFEAIEASNKEHAATTKEMSKEERKKHPEQHWMAWQAVLTATSTLANFKKDTVLVEAITKYEVDIQQLPQDQLWELLHDEVKHVKVSKAFNKSDAKLEITMLGRSNNVWKQIRKFLTTHCKCDLKSGSAPRTGLMRETQILLDKLHRGEEEKKEKEW